jgi:hypothetical protein
MTISEYLWFAAVALGPVILGAAVAYALLRRRRLTRRERVESREATEDLYRRGP